MTAPVTVVCVLRTGPRFIDRKPYSAAHAAKLQRGVAEHLSVPHRFVCMTDIPNEVEAAGVKALPLPGDWLGWWSKINLFAPDAFIASTLYFDLDTLIVGDLTPLIRTKPGITMVADFYGPDKMNSSTMAWNGDFSAVWQTFAANAAVLAKRYDARRGSLVGDQGFIHDVLRNAAQPIDTFDPAHVISFKKKALAGPPPDARVVSFHGSPKPDSPAAGWAHEAWTAL